MKILILSLLLNASPKIIGGSEVKASDPVAKHTVLLVGKIYRASFTCTGVILTKNLILTAQHCLGSTGWAEVTVHFRLKKDGAGSSAEVIDRWAMNDKLPTERPSDWDDLAIVKIKGEIPAGYSPVKRFEGSLSNNQTLLLAGYGRTTPGMVNNESPGLGVLRQVEQVLLDANYASREILVSLKDRGACAGDSGGPAYLKSENELFLVGIASRMTDNNLVQGSKPPQYQCTVDMVYSNISAQDAWIDQIIKDVSPVPSWN